MNSIQTIGFTVAVFHCTLVFAIPCLAGTKPPAYPITRVDSVRYTMHGITVNDPYRWLEDDRSAEVEAWVAGEQKTTAEFLSQIPFRSKLAERVKQVNTFESISQPWHRGQYTFFYKNDGKSNHSVLMVTNNVTGTTSVLIDPNTFSDDGTVALAFARESIDGRYLAFGKTKAGSDWRTVYVMEIATGKLLSDVIVGIKNGGVAWYKNGFFYERYDNSTSNLSLTERNTGEYSCYHVIGEKQEHDAIVFRDTTRPTMSVGVWVPERCPYIVRYESDQGSRGNRLYVKYIGDNANWNADGEYVKIFENANDAFWPAFYANDSFYGTTTWDAPNERVVRISSLQGTPTMETIIPETLQPISAMAWGGGRIFITRMMDVHDHVSVYDTTGRRLATVDLPGNGNVGGFHGDPEDTVLYYTYSSFLTPTTIYTYNVTSNTSSVFYKVTPPYNPANFREQQVWVTSKDGTRLPMFVLHKVGINFNRKAPTMVFGYGGFGITYGPGFNANYIPWLEQGGVVAIPNLRGGGEYGEKWHQAGTKLNKQNVFDDCVAAAEWLVQNGITSSEYLALNGRSNGGLLVGSVMLQRPELFRVAVPEVGVLDMLRFHLFTVGRYWVTDYGSVENKDVFEALLSYSPYHNVKEGVEYPSTMVMTSDHDDRVVPAHSFKFAAMLQAKYKGLRPMLLRVESQSGHGAVNRQKALDNVADKYAFMWHEMGFTPVY